MFLPVSVCLSVSKITQKRVPGFSIIAMHQHKFFCCADPYCNTEGTLHLDEMLRVDRCRDMDELINF